MKCLFNLAINPPARKRVLGITEQNLVPKANAAIHLFVNIVAWKQLVDIQPAPYSLTLKSIVEFYRKRFISMAVAYEAGVELNWMICGAGRKDLVKQIIYLRRG